jgi:zinc and cadmium transporter
MDVTLRAILLTTTLSGVISISAAAFLSFGLLARMADRMLSFSVGIMLATSLLHALPEALHAKVSPESLFATLLAGLLSFFLIEKVAILRAGAQPQLALQAAGHAVHAHDHHHSHGERSGAMVLLGDALHNFTDGIMIAAAFLADPSLGILTGLAIVAHEIPQEVGDFVVLLNAGYSRAKAYLFNLLCSMMALLGGILGFYTLDKASGMVPYVLAFASAGFLYVAISHLMPQLQRKATLADTMPQLGLIAIGVLGVALLID